MSLISKVRDRVIGEEDKGVMTNPKLVTNKYHDIDDILPAPARKRLQTFRDAAEDAYAACIVVSDALREARTDEQKAITHERQLRHPTDGKYPETDEEGLPLRQAKATIKAAGEKRARLQERHDMLSARWHEPDRLVNRCESYLGDMGGKSLALAKGNLPTARKGENPAKAVDRIRNEIADMRAELHRVRSAPRPSSDVKAVIRAEIEKMAETGKPDVFGAIEHGNPIKWPARRAGALVTAAGGETGITGFTSDMIPDGIGVTCWLFKDQLIAALEAEVDALADDAEALSDEERASAEAKLLADILTAERAECALIEEAGEALSYREDVDVRAVLGIEGPAPRDNYA